jgi:uncharacterized membrane protein YphA (DoxX/SURF4 family)
VTRIWGNPWIGLVLRLVLAGVLLYAGTVKLLEPNGAREAIVAYRIFSGAATTTILGWALPIGEVLLGVLLLVGLFVRWAGLATALLMTGFIAGIASVWARGYSIDCGCFGGGGDISGDGVTWRYTSEILRDFLFVGMSVWLVTWPGTRLALDPSHKRTAYGVPRDDRQRPQDTGATS